MGRHKKNESNNQSSTSFGDERHNTKIRFADADEDLDAVNDATESSNLDDSMMSCDPEPSAVAMDESLSELDDKTSADYYFDSYSHFGTLCSIHLLTQIHLLYLLIV